MAQPWHSAVRSQKLSLLEVKFQSLLQMKRKAMMGQVIKNPLFSRTSNPELYTLSVYI